MVSFNSLGDAASMAKDLSVVTHSELSSFLCDTHIVYEVVE